MLSRTDIGEEEHLLEGDGDLTAQRVHRRLPDVDAVDGDRPRRHVVEAWQEHRRGRLARAARTHQRHGLAGAHGQVEAVEHVAAALVVVEVHVGEADLRAHRAERHGVGRVDDVRRACRGCRATARRPARACWAIAIAVASIRTGETIWIRYDENARNVPSEMCPSIASQPPKESTATWPSDGDRRQRRGVQRLDPHQPGARLVQPLRGAGQVAQLALLLAEALDDAHAGDRLVDDAGHLAGALLGVPRGREHGVAHLQPGHQQQRHHQQGDQRQRAATGPSSR